MGLPVYVSFSIKGWEVFGWGVRGGLPLRAAFMTLHLSSEWTTAGLDETKRTKRNGWKWNEMKVCETESRNWGIGIEMCVLGVLGCSGSFPGSPDSANSIALRNTIPNPQYQSPILKPWQHPSPHSHQPRFVFPNWQKCVLFEKFWISPLTWNRLTLTFIKRFWHFPCHQRVISEKWTCTRPSMKVPLPSGSPLNHSMSVADWGLPATFVLYASEHFRLFNICAKILF